MPSPSQVKPTTAHAAINSNFNELRGLILTLIESWVPEGRQGEAAMELAKRFFNEAQKNINEQVIPFLKESSHGTEDRADRGS